MQLKNPIISVIMPVYNAENTLEQAIGSILKQSFKDFELLLIDDGSTDNSGNICDNFMKSDSRIKVYHLQNGGVANAKNFALDKIQGEYFCICDSDDYYNDRFLNDGYKIFQKHDVDLFIGGIVEELWQINKIIAQKEYSAGKNYITTPKNIIEKIGVEFDPCIFVSSCVKIYKTSIVKKYNLKHLEITLGEDYCFNFDYLKHINSAYFSKTIYYHYRRINTTSLYTKINDDIYNIVSTTFDKREEISLYYSGSDELIERIKKERIINLISTLHKYYSFPKITTKSQKFSLIKKIIHDKSIKQAKASQFINKRHRLILRIIKTKNVRLIHLLFKIYHRRNIK